jgi:hypothetical protein
MRFTFAEQAPPAPKRNPVLTVLRRAFDGVVVVAVILAVIETFRVLGGLIA